MKTDPRPVGEQRRAHRPARSDPRRGATCSSHEPYSPIPTSGSVTATMAIHGVSPEQRRAGRPAAATASHAWTWLIFTLATVAASTPVRGVTVPGASRSTGSECEVVPTRRPPERGDERGEQGDLDVPAPDPAEHRRPEQDARARSTRGWPGVGRRRPRGPACRPNQATRTASSGRNVNGATNGSTNGG